MLDFAMNDAEPGEFLFVEEPGQQNKTSERIRASGWDIEHVAALDLIVAARTRPGFDAVQVSTLRDLVADIASGSTGPCKFLVIDLGAGGTEAAATPPGFDALIDAVANLIFEVPVISIAWARGFVAGPDLELALACSMLAGETEARFSFDVDLVSALRSYSLLAHKIGFVQAERLMEGAALLDAAALHELMLLHSVVPVSSGLEGIRSFVTARSRRHNSACGIYRAQRIAMLAA